MIRSSPVSRKCKFGRFLSGLTHTHTHTHTHTDANKQTAEATQDFPTDAHCTLMDVNVYTLRNKSYRRVPPEGLRFYLETFASEEAVKGSVFVRVGVR